MNSDYCSVVVVALLSEFLYKNDTLRKGLWCKSLFISNYLWKFISKNVFFPFPLLKHKIQV